MTARVSASNASKRWGDAGGSGAVSYDATEAASWQSAGGVVDPLAERFRSGLGFGRVASSASLADDDFVKAGLADRE
jgi:hypothetical protein